MAPSAVSSKVRDTASRSGVVIGVMTVLLVLALITVMLRVWVRTRMIRALGWDDIHMCIALFGFTLYCISMFFIMANGGGTHVRKLELVKNALAWAVAAKVFYMFTMIFAKIALAMLFLRLVIMKWQRRLIYYMVGLHTIITAGTIIEIIFACGNPRFYIERVITRQCVSPSVQLAFGYTQAAVGVGTDWMFAILPIFFLRTAQMDMKTKLTVGFTLFLGTSGSIGGIVRIIYIKDVIAVDDFFWVAVNLALWSCIELGIAIIVGSLVTLRPLFKRIVYNTSLSSRSHGGRMGSESKALDRELNVVNKDVDPEHGVPLRGRFSLARPLNVFRKSKHSKEGSGEQRSRPRSGGIELHHLPHAESQERIVKEDDQTAKDRNQCGSGTGQRLCRHASGGGVDRDRFHQCCRHDDGHQHRTSDKSMSLRSSESSMKPLPDLPGFHKAVDLKVMAEPQNLSRT